MTARLMTLLIFISLSSFGADNKNLSRLNEKIRKLEYFADIQITNGKNREQKRLKIIETQAKPHIIRQGGIKIVLVARPHGENKREVHLTGEFFHQNKGKEELITKTHVYTKLGQKGKIQVTSSKGPILKAVFTPSRWY